MQGTFKLDPDYLEQSSFDICIDATTINTKNKKRDAHLKDPDFFEVDTYPTICYVSERIQKLDAGYSTTGDLTIHGVTKSVTIPFTFDGKTFSGEVVINRFDYDLGKDYGTMRVGTEATVSIECVVN